MIACIRHLNRLNQTVVPLARYSCIIDTIPEIDRLIIPLYSRIQLSYEDIRTIFLRMVSTYQENWEGPIVGRIFLASANTYREYINEIDDTANPSPI